MVRASVTLGILLFISFILNLVPEYQGLVGTLVTFFEVGGLTTIMATIATVAVPAVLIGVSFFSGSSAFALAGTLIILPLVTFPFGLFTSAVVPTQVKFLFSGIYLILIAMSGVAIMRGDT